MKMTTPTANPMRILRSLAFRMRHLNPLDLIPTIIERQVDRETTALTTCVGETVKIERGVDHAARRLHEALNDKQSPGIVTTAEARGIARTLIRTKGEAYIHRQHLEQLAQ